jgi:hypothetical protein
MHVDHCIETLRLGIMCTSDITPVLLERNNYNNLGTSLDFNVHHKCRNFDKIAQYVDNMNHDVVLPGSQSD